MTSRFGHQLGIDWSQQGTYANVLEDVSSLVTKGDVEISWGRSVDGGVTLASTAGTLTFTLNNHEQDLSQENASSPIAGKVLPGRGVRYQVTRSGSIYTLLDGTLDTFTIDGDLVSHFSGSALDGWGRPGAKTLSTQLYSGLRTGDAINLVLDEINWTGGRDIDPGATVMPWWWEEGTDANEAVTKLVNSEGPPAVAFVEGGTFHFHDRHHRLLNTRSQVSQGLYTHISPAGSGPPGDFKIEKETFVYDHGLKTIVNTVTFSVGQRAPQDLAEVWTSDDLLTMSSGATMQITAQPSDPFLGAVTPTVAADGDIQLQSGTISSVTLSRTSGQSTIISITCSADTVISRIALRAYPVTVARTVQVSAADAGSVGIFEEQRWPDESAPVWAGLYDAQAIATRIVVIYANYRPTITFTVVGFNAAHLNEILQTRISDRITVRNDRRGINSDFIIERLLHRITNLGQVHRLVISCQAPEPVQPDNVFTFDAAGKGFNDGAFGVDGIDSADTVFIFDTAGHGFNDGVFGT